jgi:hypothetical protein
MLHFDHRVDNYLVWLSQWALIISLNSTKQLVFAMETMYVFYMVSTEFLCTIFTPIQDEDFSLKSGAQMCEIILNLQMKCWTAPHQTRSYWTGPCIAKPWPASPNHHVKSPIFRNITQHRVVIPYQCFRTTYWSHLQGSRNPNEQSITEVNWQNLIFFWLWPSSHCSMKYNISEAGCFHLYAKKHKMWWTPQTSVTEYHSSSNLLTWVKVSL